MRAKEKLFPSSSATLQTRSIT